MYSCTAPHALPVPWKFSPEAFASVHDGAKTRRIDADRLPSSLIVRFAVPESPGSLTERSYSVSQLLFTLTSVDPPPVDRQADPPCLVSLRTSVPVANRFAGFPTCAVNVASEPEPTSASAPSMTAALIVTLFQVS